MSEILSGVEVESVRRVNVQPGDKIVIEYRDILSLEEIGRIKDYAKEFFDCRAVVLERGMHLIVPSATDEILADVEGDPAEVKGET